MKLKIVVVEDDNLKFGRVHTALVSSGVDPGDIYHAICIADAVQALRETAFDLMLLDINIPRRLGEQAIRGGGIQVLREIDRDDRLHRPRYIVGLTAYEDIVEEFGGTFDDQLWSLVHYSENSDRWIAQLATKVSYISASKTSERFSDGVTYGTDLAIICALEDVEFSAIKRLPFDWQPLRLAHDETRYQSGNIQTEKGTFSVIAAASTRMGMPNAAVLASKMIHQFRPRYLIMAGICAGRVGKVHLGDIIAADPAWDWGSGKITSVDDAPKFLPDPHHLPIDQDVAAVIKDLGDDKAELARLKEGCSGAKPPFELTVHVGPFASGAAVVAHAPTLEPTIGGHRGLLGIDMEAYGVAAAASGSGKPRPIAFSLKAVCDYADKDKDDDFQEYAASVSAKFLERVARRLL